jgi:uncharacterized protein
VTPCFNTFTKRQLNPLAIRPEDICLEDIAHHLALVNRFNGATPSPISVAQHSVYVYRLCLDSGFERHALFHDGSEAYLGDMTKWLKQSPEMAEYRRIEDIAQTAINEVFGCSWSNGEMPEVVRKADQLMVRFEAEWAGINIMVDGYGPLSKEEKLLIGNWRPWSWRQAQRSFLDAYREILREEENAIWKEGEKA